MVSPVVYLVVAALLVGLILFLTRGRGRAAAGRRCRRARAGGATRPLISSVCVGRGAAAHAHARTCQAQLTRSPRLPPPAGSTPEHARKAATSSSLQCRCQLADRVAGSLHLFPGPQRERALISSPLALPEGQALADTTILLRPLSDPQGFPIPARPAPEPLMRRGPLSVFYLPVNRKEYEVAPASSLLTPQEHPCVHAPSSLFCIPPGRPCQLPGHVTDTPVILHPGPLSIISLSAYEFGYMSLPFLGPTSYSQHLSGAGDREAEVRQIANKSSWEERLHLQVRSLIGVPDKTVAGGVRQKINTVLLWAFIQMRPGEVKVGFWKR